MRQDLDQLTALNRDYVASVQNRDVKRFEEILAPEFYCSNPDKTLVYRAAILRPQRRARLPLALIPTIACSTKGFANQIILSRAFIRLHNQYLHNSKSIYVYVHKMKFNVLLCHGSKP
ncbi:nuclear transport factor 2 family protein [Bradyrhizobium frederickii]|uniref:nuclear transport factor 2 family protein n=1 Tax=Bradyrhizobium frederickii TaxID=2560054 RepID=UPI001F2D3800|nr:nuclear transport factor 2 family protein [Bradyrhizobium frederickii]